MNPFIIASEDAAPTTLENRYRKKELALRLHEMIKAYKDHRKDIERLKTQISQLEERNSKLYRTAEIFGGERTVGNY